MRCLALTLTISALLSTACGGGTGVPPPPPSQITALAIGGGQSDGTGYVPFTDGQDVPLIAGEQGGFHVYINIRVGMSEGAEPPGSLVFDRQARLAETGDLVSKAKEKRMMVPSAAEQGMFEEPRAMLMFLCPSPAGIRVSDQAIVLHVKALADSASTDPLAEGTIKLTPRCPEGDLAEFCNRICSG